MSVPSLKERKVPEITQSFSTAGQEAGAQNAPALKLAASIVALFWASLLLNGCYLTNLPGTKSDSTVPAVEEKRPEAGGPLTRLVERAKEDLILVYDASTDEIAVVSAEEVEWGDTALGCPGPDQVYTQVITPGYFILLQAGGETFSYHTGIDPEGPIVQCTEEGFPAGEPPPASAPVEFGIVVEVEDALPRLIERAVQELVQAAASDEVEVVSAEEVEWNDSGLGCPEPDTMYLQVITPGYLITLAADGETHAFHAGFDPEGPLVLCVDGQPQQGETQMDDEAATLSAPQGDALPRLIERATQDLVETSGAAAGEVTLLRVEEVEWSDTSLGCPDPEGMYAQVVTPGYRIMLEAGGDTYAYHSGADPEGPLVQCDDDDSNG